MSRITPFEFICDKCLIKNLSYFIAPTGPSDGFFPATYPIQVYNQAGIVIGTANNKNEYISLWNSDVSNQAVGVLSGWYGNQFRLDTTKVLVQDIPGFSGLSNKLFLLDNGDGTYLKVDNNIYLTVK